MEDYDIVSIEMELDRLRDEKENSDIAATGAKSKTGCLMSIIYFVAGIVLIRIIGELLGNL
jgi:hypothetical protein